MRVIHNVILSVIFLSVVGCGAGFEIPPLRPQGNVHGTASGGQLQGATLRIYSLEGMEKGELLGETDVNNEGSYALNIRAKSQPVLLEINGGSYFEPASGKQVTIEEGMTLSALAEYKSGEPLNINVSELTHMVSALVRFRYSQGEALPAAVENSYTAFNEVFGVNVRDTRPWPISKPKPDTVEVDAEHVLGFYLAAISSWTEHVSEEAQQESHVNFHTIGFSQLVYQDLLADGLLDGRGYQQSEGELVDFYYGKQKITADVYRITLAQHMLAVARTKENRTIFKPKQLLAVAHGFATSHHAIFGEDEPGEFEEQAPPIFSLEAENIYQNGVFRFAVAIGGITGAEKVEFFVDDILQGAAEDPNKPFFDIDTGNYDDGEHEIVVVATNVFEKQRSASFVFKFDNTGPIVNVTSTNITNQHQYEMTGEYSDSGVGVKQLIVQGQRALLKADGTWSAVVELEIGINKITLSVTDELDNASDEQTLSIALDQSPPRLDSEGSHSQALFISGEQLIEQSLQDDNRGVPLFVPTHKISPIGVGVNKQSLDENGIPYFAFSVSDPVVEEVGSSQDDISVERQYRINNQIVSDWNPVIKLDGEYIIPLMSDGLDKAWHNSTPADEHKLVLRVQDLAGNTTTRNFLFNADFRVTEINLDTNILPVGDELFGQYTGPGFPDRAELNNRAISVLRYTYTNSTTHAHYIQPEENAQHVLFREYDEAVRVNKMTWTISEEWRSKQVTADFTSPDCRTADETIEPSAITEIVNFIGSDQWELQTVPETFISMEPRYADSDLPTPFATNWSQFHFDDKAEIFRYGPIPNLDGRKLYRRYNFDYLLDIDKPNEHSMVVGWEYYEVLESGDEVILESCDDVSYLERRLVFTDPVPYTENINGQNVTYPINVIRTDLLSDPVDFTTTTFVVEDSIGGEISPQSGWFRVGPGKTVWIDKVVATPDLENFDNDQVIDLDNLTSYTPVFHDRQIAWQVGQGLNINVVHDAGVANIPSMSAVIVTLDAGVRNFVISR